MGDPEVSVIIPAFGRQDLLSRALASAVAQDVDLEIIVVDDGSPTPLRLDEIGDRMRLIRTSQNLGAAAARNRGVAEARADWIAFLDSDDIWPARSLAERLAVARKTGSEKPVIWAAGFEDVRANGSRRARIPVASSRARDFASGCWTCPGSTALLARQTWEAAGGQDEALRRLEDYEWLLRWGLSGGRIETWRGIGAHITRGQRAPPDIVAAAAQYILQKHSGLAPALLRRVESYLALEAGASHLHAGEHLSGISALARSWLKRPRLRAALESFWR